MSIRQSAKKGRRSHHAPALAAGPVDDTVAEEVMSHETKSVSKVTCHMIQKRRLI